jgi:polyferredoxin
MTFAQRCYLVLADGILVIHAAFVAFVILGLALVWIGWFVRWAFVRNLWFRLAHLAAIGVVAAESLTGFVCPLTTWEDRLRLLAGGEERYAGSFIQHWLHRVLFYDASEHVFTIAYIAFFTVVALSLWLVPPRLPGGSRQGMGKGQA